MFVSEICSWQLDTAEATEGIVVAARRMNDRNVGALVVVAENGKPVGMITDRDITIRVTALGRDATRMNVGDVMSTDVVTVDEASSIGQGLQLMRAGGFRRLLVVNRGGQAIGIVTLDDIFAMFSAAGEIATAIVRRNLPRHWAKDVDVGSKPRQLKRWADGGTVETETVDKKGHLEIPTAACTAPPFVCRVHQIPKDG